MTKNIIIGVLAVLVLVFGFQAFSGGVGGTTNFNDLSIDTLAVAGTITSTGTITNTSTGTSTLFMKSTSAVKGACTEFNATSSATVLNLTYAASTTISQSTVGVIPVIKYGVCS